MNHDLIEMGLYGLWLLLLATWRALPLLAIALAMDLLLRRRLAAKYHALLWTLVIVRLLLPLSVPSTWSLHGPLATFLWGETTVATPLPEPLYTPREIYICIGDLTPMPVISWDHPIAPPTSHWDTIVPLALIFVWALVAAGSLLRGLMAHVRFAIRLRRCRELQDPSLIDLVLRECDALRVRRRPKLKEVAELSSPAVFGLWRCTICLPPNTIASLSAEEFRWLLRHELAHVRRRDAWLLSLASVMQSLHWFNPLAWLAVARLRSHVESAADELALRSASSSDAIAYGRLLLKFAEQASSPSHLPALGFLRFVSGHRLRERIQRITHGRVPSWRGVRWIVALSILILAVAGLTDASQPQVPDAPAIHLPQVSLAVQPPKEASQEPASLHTYDITEVLEQIQNAHPQEDAGSFLLAIKPLLTPEREVHIQGNRLTVAASASEHEALTYLLEAWRQGGPQQIVIELRIMQADLALASSIDWVAAKINAFEQHGSQPAVAARITEDQLLHLIRNMYAKPHNNILMAPKLTVFNGQGATFANLSKRPFVTAVEPLADHAYQPIITVLEDGLKIRVRPKAIGDGTVELSFDLQLSEIGEVAMANLPFGNASQPHDNVTIQVPHISTSSLRATTSLRANESVLVVAPHLFSERSPESSTMALFYTFTPRLIPAADLPGETVTEGSLNSGT